MSEPVHPHHFHGLQADEALGELEKDRGGLSADEARRRLDERGSNRLPEPPRRNVVLRFLAHFHNVLIYVLLGSAAVTAVLCHVVETVVILAVVLANAVIGFIQEGRAEEAMVAIREILSPKSAVLRGGRTEIGRISGLLGGV
jgi:magnesium-transporting ATPase (P-type)